MHDEDWMEGPSSPKHCFPAGDREDLRAQEPAPVQGPIADFWRAGMGALDSQVKSGLSSLDPAFQFFV